MSIFSMIIELVSNALGAVKELLGIQSKKITLKNAEDIKKAEILKEEQLQQDKVNKAIANKDEDEIRKAIS